MHPCILAIKGARELRRWIVLVKKDWRTGPTVRHLADLIPVRIPAFWEDKYNWAALKLQVSVVSRRLWTDIFFISALQRLERVFGGVAVILFRLVVHQRNVEVLFARHLLDQGIAAIKERMTPSVPIHGKGINTQFLRFLDLPMNDRRIIAVVLNP